MFKDQMEARSVWSWAYTNLDPPNTQQIDWLGNAMSAAISEQSGRYYGYGRGDMCQVA